MFVLAGRSDQILFSFLEEDRNAQIKINIRNKNTYTQTLYISFILLFKFEVKNLFEVTPKNMMSYSSLNFAVSPKIKPNTNSLIQFTKIK